MAPAYAPEPQLSTLQFRDRGAVIRKACCMMQDQIERTSRPDCKSGWSKPGPRQSVAFGLRVVDALPQAQQRINARRMVLVTTNSLARPGGLAELVFNTHRASFVSVISGVRAHTPRTDVVRIASALRGADGVVSLGGGSVCDAVKAARLALAHGIVDADDIDRLRHPPASEDVSDNGLNRLPTLPHLAIPTTLSASEYTSFAGVTDERGPRKEALSAPGMAPDIVLLDPAMTLATPSRLWLATGVRAVDHAVETWCAVNATPFSDATSLHAMRLLVRGLLRCGRFADDLQARQACLEGAWLAIQGLSMGVDAGASHGIGHALGGTAGMPHGETSCVMLPHVLRYNMPVNAERQAVLAAAAGSPERDLADIVANLVHTLGLPQRLRDAGVFPDQIVPIAQAAMHDRWLQTNPRPLTTQADVLRILQSAW